MGFGIYDAFESSWNQIAMIPAMTVISIMLFGIEEIATQLEEPFTVLPMQAFCDKIYNWCMEIVSWEAGDNGMPEPLEQPRTVSSKGTTGIVAEDSASVDKPTFFVETTTRIDEIEEIVSSPINEDEEVEETIEE